MRVAKSFSQSNFGKMTKIEDFGDFSAGAADTCFDYSKNTNFFEF
jgi:hypothetical protein